MGFNSGFKGLKMDTWQSLYHTENITTAFTARCCACTV